MATDNRIRDDVEALVQALEKTCNDMRERVAVFDEAASERKRATFTGAAIVMTGLSLSASLIATEVYDKSGNDTEGLTALSSFVALVIVAASAVFGWWWRAKEHATVREALSEPFKLSQGIVAALVERLERNPGAFDTDSKLRKKRAEELVATIKTRFRFDSRDRADIEFLLKLGKSDEPTSENVPTEERQITNR